MNNGLYQFPATRYTRNSLLKQWRHLFSEVIEVGLAILFRDPQGAAMETWDVKHSSETLHRILSGRGADIQLAREAVIGNNLELGYYEEKPCK